MAKKIETTETNGAGESANVDMALTYDSWAIQASELGWPAGAAIDPRIAYLLANGFKQSMTDAAAFSKADKEGKSADDVAAMAKEARDKRFKAIVEGTIGTRESGPRKMGLERVVADVAIDAIRLKAAGGADGTGKRFAMPTGAVLTHMVEAWLAVPANREMAETEAKRRMASPVAPDSADDEIAAMLEAAKAAAAAKPKKTAKAA
jgi:hypothetical protein